ncbi:MAG: CdaR family transcriptional regulator [Bacillus sp. (in: firmicutes)]
MLTEEIAKEIVYQTMTRLDRNINIMNDKGIIIASGDLDRIRQRHGGAKEVIRTGKPLIIDEQNLHLWEGTCAGINLPIEFQGSIIGVIGITGNPEEIMEFGELVKMITEMMIKQSFIADQYEWKQALIESVFDELLMNTASLAPINQRLRVIGVHLEPPYQIGILELNKNKLGKNDLLYRLNELFEETDTLIGFLTINRLFILTSNLPEAEARRRMESAVQKLNDKGASAKIGVGSVICETALVHQSFDEALCALKFGDRNQTIIPYNEIEAKALLGQLGEQTRNKFAARMIGSLSSMLVETLECFLDCNLNIGICAKQLYIHRNSLVYRLKKIKDITGYNPQNVQDAFHLQLAIWLWNMKENEYAK